MHHVDVFEVRARVGALVSKPAALIVIFSIIPTFEAAVIEHVESYEVGHLVVHFLPVTQLEGQVLVIIVFTRLTVRAQCPQVKLSRVVHDIRAHRHEG